MEALLKRNPPRLIPTQGKRAAVGIIIRPCGTKTEWYDFEILYMARAKNPRDRWSGHVNHLI